MKEKIRENALWLLLSSGLIAVDAVSKLWAETTLRQSGRQPIIEGIIGFMYAENTGAAFSALSGSTVLLSLISLAICVFIVGYMFRTSGKNILTNLALSMILAGGVGNLIDRVTRGYVVDFFELRFMKFAIFNVADVLITVGAVLLFIALLRAEVKSDERVEH